ncbi:Firmicu-CTERM sorting domain-containing protein [Lactiplantibacillus modestisalitolerans]|uniref:Firmicu-CTERM sorting domain-containing protein n=1 Tax=Lactiplantibacillus modestisalitolerans TaxID=1457219 RepID=A0ABV5WVU4_9LACO
MKFRTNRQWLLWTLALILGLATFWMPARAATNINIDGNVDDWQNVAKTKTSSQAEVAMVVNNGQLYFYVAMNPTGTAPTAKNNWEVRNQFYLRQKYFLKVGGNTYELTPQPLNNQSYQAPKKVGQKVQIMVNVYSNKTGSYNNNGNASAYVTAVKNNSQDGYQNVFEGKVPLSDLQLTDEQQNFTLSGGGYGVGSYSTKNQVATNPASQSSASSSSSSTTEPGQQYDGHPNIKIDGGFDDWAGVSKTKIREPGDDFNVKEGALLQYDGNLYIYINMSPNRGSGYRTLQPSDYKLTIGNVVYDLTIENADGQTYQALSKVDQTQAITMGVYNEKTNDWQAKPAGASGYVTRKRTATGGFTDIFEVKLPLKALGASADDGQTITLKNSTLGAESMTVSGGSTGPILLAGSGFGLALLGFWQYRRRRSLEDRL